MCSSTGKARRLEHEHISAAHVLQDLYVALAILETMRHRLPPVQTQVITDFVRQFGVSRAGEDLELVVDTALRFALLSAAPDRLSFLPEQE